MYGTLSYQQHMNCHRVMLITPIIYMGDCLVVPYIIPTFVLSVVQSETGQGNKFFSKRVGSDLHYSLVWGKYIRQVGVY